MRIDYIINSMEGGGAQTPIPRIVQALEKAGGAGPRACPDPPQWTGD